MISILIPTCKRLSSLLNCIDSLMRIDDPSGLEVIVAVDADPSTKELVEIYLSRHTSFGAFKVVLSEKRQYSIGIYNLAFKASTQEVFIWLADDVIIRKTDFITRFTKWFYEDFPDGIGVMSLSAQGGAGFGISTKSFVIYNDDEFFHSGYRDHYADTELTKRAILMGRYSWAHNSNMIEHDGNLSEVDEKIRYDIKRTDGVLFGKRQELRFMLDPSKILYPDYNCKEWEKVIMVLPEKLGTKVLPISVGRRTEKLLIDDPGGKIRFYQSPGCSFHGLLILWWIHFGLEGHGAMIGDTPLVGEELLKQFPKITKLDFINLEKVAHTLVWDITKPISEFMDPPYPEYDWIICQAVLEHVIDPYGAVKNLVSVLKPGKLLFLHTVGPEFPYHRYPIDCYRFFRDIFIKYAEEFDLEIEDIYSNLIHTFVAYRKKNGN